MEKKYIHGVETREQERLLLLNKLTNTSFLDFLSIKNGDNVLELGSGLGVIATTIANQHPDSNVIGIEISNEQIAACPPVPKNLTYIQNNVSTLNFDNHHFDKIYGRYILEHLSDPIGSLKEAYRVLKPGGMIFFQENTISLMRLYPECPSFELIWKKFIILQKKLGGDAEIGKKLFYLLKSVGFKEVIPSYHPEIHYLKKGTLLGWVENLIGNVQGASSELINEGLTTDEQINKALKELKKFSKKDDSLAMFYWNRIQATK